MRVSIPDEVLLMNQPKKPNMWVVVILWAIQIAMVVALVYAVVTGKSTTPLVIMGIVFAICIRIESSD
jgi:hypothetical protein